MASKNLKAYSLSKRCSVNLPSGEVHFEANEAEVTDAQMVELLAVNSPDNMLFSQEPFPRQSSSDDEAPTDGEGEPPELDEVIEDSFERGEKELEENQNDDPGDSDGGVGDGGKGENSPVPEKPKTTVTSKKKTSKKTSKKKAGKAKSPKKNNR